MTLREFFAGGIPVSVTFATSQNGLATTTFADVDGVPSDPHQTMLEHDAGQLWLDAEGITFNEFSNVAGDAPVIVGEDAKNNWIWNAQGGLKNCQGTSVLYLRAERSPALPAEAELTKDFARVVLTERTTRVVLTERCPVPPPRKLQWVAFSGEPHRSLEITADGYLFGFEAGKIRSFDPEGNLRFGDAVGMSWPVAAGLPNDDGIVISGGGFNFDIDDARRFDPSVPGPDYNRITITLHGKPVTHVREILEYFRDK